MSHKVWRLAANCVSLTEARESETIEKRAGQVVCVRVIAEEDSHLRDGQQRQNEEDVDHLDLKVKEVLDSHTILQEWIVLIDLGFHTMPCDHPRLTPIVRGRKLGKAVPVGHCL